MPDSQQVNDSIINSIVFERVPFTTEPNLVLIDGYPRYQSAVELFLNTLRQNRQRFVGTIALEITLEESLRRAANRDSKREGSLCDIQERYWQYETETRKAIELLSRSAAVKTVDASGSIKEVQTLFSAAIDSLLTPQSK